MMNVLFDFSLAHHFNFSVANEFETATITPCHDSHHQAQESDDDCADGTCHSGHCKLINLTLITLKPNISNESVYTFAPITIHESPYLLGNRRPP